MTAEVYRHRFTATIAFLLLSVTGAGTIHAATKAKGLHIPTGIRQGFNWTLNDGGGYRWDIQSYGTVGQGSNYAYGGGLYCQIYGNNVRSNSGYAWRNKSGDEIEIGPYSRNNLRCYRRIKIYKKRGLARWLDIFENTSGRDITVPVAIYTNINYGIRQTTTSSGGNNFGDKDWGFITQSSRNGSPHILHMVCGKQPKLLRPSVQIRGSQIYVRWNLTIPAGKTRILCYFESQDRNIDSHKATLKKFRIHKVLKDLSPSVRKLIVNWSTSGFAGVDLERVERSDSVVIAGGSPKYGTITNESFRVETFLGTLNLPAKDVIGMKTVSRQAQRVCFVLKDGQILSAPIPRDKIHLSLATGGTLKIPFDRIDNWSYRISKDRPAEAAPASMTMFLRSGDRLGFDPSSLKLSFRTRYGTIPLNPHTLLNISLDNPSNTIHQVTFLTGSSLGGFLEPRKISMKLKLGETIEVPREMIVSLRFATEGKDNKTLSHAVLSNGDELFGALTEKHIEVASEFGTVKVKPCNIKNVIFGRTAGWAKLKLWDDTELAGRVSSKHMSFVIDPETQLKITPVQCVSIVCPNALPPAELVTEVRKLLAQLGSESFKDRNNATERLKKIGRPIIPILRQYPIGNDPEVRNRINDILKELGEKIS